MTSRDRPLSAVSDELRDIANALRAGVGSVALLANQLVEIAAEVDRIANPEPDADDVAMIAAAAQRKLIRTVTGDRLTLVAWRPRAHRNQMRVRRPGSAREFNLDTDQLKEVLE